MARDAGLPREGLNFVRFLRLGHRARANFAVLVELLEHRRFAAGTVTNFAALPFLVQRGIPVINPAGSNEKLNAPIEKEVFGMLPVGQTIGENMAQYALKTLKADKVAIFYQNDQFGKDQRDGAVAHLKANGKTPVGEATYVPSDVDMSAQAVALRDAKPDVVLMFNIVKQGALLLKEAEKLGWKPQFMAMNTMGDPILTELAGKAANG